MLPFSLVFQRICSYQSSMTNTTNKRSAPRTFAVSIPEDALKVILLGRPNVGKSTLFNRLIRANRAITHDRPGVTRDRMEGLVRSKGSDPFVLVDTGGITLDGHPTPAEGPAGIRGFEAEILRQAEAAMGEAALLCLVVSGKDGCTPFDEHLAAHIRRANKPVLLVVNKIDGIEREDELTAEFHSLGFPLLAVSAEHGHNIRTLENTIRDMLPEVPESDLPGESTAKDNDELGAEGIFDDMAEIFDGSAPDDITGTDEESAPSALEDDDANAPLRVALLGKPNVGKSSLVNALVGESRMIVSDVAGTTRDSVDVKTRIGDQDVTFVDTAGVRRRAKITDQVERYSVNASLKSTTKAHVTLLLIDALEGVTQQDKRLIDLLDERKTPFFILVNKIDLAPRRQLADLKKAFTDMLQFCPHVPVLFVSAQKRRGLNEIVPMASQIRQECGVRVPTGQLNRAMESVLTAHQPPVVRRCRPKFFYLTQAESHPPTFVFFVSDAERVTESYTRYLEKALRRIFQIKHAPMRVRLRSSHTKNKDK